LYLTRCAADEVKYAIMFASDANAAASWSSGKRVARFVIESANAAARIGNVASL
jgi:hypothetical protein